VDTLSRRSQRGDLAVIDDCQFVFFGTADPTRPWEPIHVSGYQLVVMVDLRGNSRRVESLFSLGPYHDVVGRIGIEFDGDGLYRVRQDIELFPPRLHEWTPIPTSGSIELELVVDLVDHTWSTMIGGEEVSALPLLSPTDDGDVPVRPHFADHTASASVDIVVDAAPPSASCREALSDRTG
jgi:hypothetical protein